VQERYRQLDLDPAIVAFRDDGTRLLSLGRWIV
jgi:hypothetical protein